MSDQKKGEHKAGKNSNQKSGKKDASAFSAAFFDADALEAQWQRVRSRLRAELGEATFNSWFKSLSIRNAQRGCICLQVPTRFIGSWIEANYLTRLRNHWQAENEHVKRIQIEVHAAWAPIDTTPETREQKILPARNLAPPRAANAPFVPNAAFLSSKDPRRLNDMHDTPGVPLDPRFTFDNFIIGKSNALAHAAAMRASDPQEAGNNPLFLYGGVGLGKTHLMHALAWEIRRKSPSRQVLYLSAEKFMYQFIRALRQKDMMAFKQQFREVDVLMIDDIQFIAGKDSTQEEFFHTFNALIDHNRQLIISADRAPAALTGIEERMRSRLGGGLVADIQPTDYELRLGIVQSKSVLLAERARTAPIPRPVLEFLAGRITHSVRELEGALNRVLAYASFSGKAINLDMTQEILRDLLRAAERRVSIDEIQRHVADYYNIRLGDLTSPRRARAVARPRQVAMYLAKQLTMRSLPEIGRKFGGRDHTTVIHAVRRIEELRAMDPTLDEDVDLLARMLET